MLRSACTHNSGRITVAHCDGFRQDCQDYVPTDEVIGASVETIDFNPHPLEDIDQTFAKVDDLRRQEVANGRLNRYNHRYNGFGDGERFNPKRRRWNINRRNATRSVAQMRGL